MSVLVVDASIGVKWFVQEVHSVEARAWRSGPDSLNAPAYFFDLEIANVLWKKVRRAEISRAEADLILGQLPAVPMARHSENPLIAPAFNLADRAGRTVYDCLYRNRSAEKEHMHTTFSAELRHVNINKSAEASPDSTKPNISAFCFTFRCLEFGLDHLRYKLSYRYMCIVKSAERLRLYLALAVQLSGRMLTADQRFYNSLAATPWASYLRWVTDLPQGP